MSIWKPRPYSGDNQILPRPFIIACTSVVTNISYHKSREIRAEVSFLAKAEWMQEIRALLGDWASYVDEANVSGKSGDLREEAKIAWEKVCIRTPHLLPRLDEVVGSCSISRLEPRGARRDD